MGQGGARRGKQAPAAPVLVPVPAPPGLDADIADFRVVSHRVMAVCAMLAIASAVRGLPAPFEVALAFGGLAAAIRLAIALFPATHPRLAELHPRRFFRQTWAELDREADAARAARARDGTYDARPLVALSVGAVCLALMEYFGHAPTFHEVMDGFDSPLRIGPPTNVWGEIRDSRWVELAEFAWWSAWRVFGYALVPIAVVKLWFKERLRDHGRETRGFTEHAWIYALAYVVVLLCVILVARHDAHFREYYPFYGHASRSWLDFGLWELLYAAQFFSLELFFRGFWLSSMKRSLGSYAIFAMTVPYCMIHFGKPFLETLAAIVAGIVLGTLALKTRSIWSGFLIHVSVAVSMDVAALLATRGLPSTFWPGP